MATFNRLGRRKKIQLYGECSVDKIQCSSASKWISPRIPEPGPYACANLFPTPSKLSSQLWFPLMKIEKNYADILIKIIPSKLLRNNIKIGYLPNEIWISADELFFSRNVNGTTSDHVLKAFITISLTLL